MRSALIVGTNNYRDARLRQLRAPALDAQALAEVLSDAERGGFEVEVLTDPEESTLRRRVSSFFRERARDDLLLLHFSCHGVKNEHGDLHFAAVDTDLDNLEATAISAEFVNTLMARSLSRRVVLLLDCCYSGAFGRSALARGGGGVELKERFEGRGRVVLTASTAMEYAFEGSDVIGEGKPSVFSAAVVEGIRSGEADFDGDGEISVDDLYDYVYDAVRAETPSQTPSKWSFDVQGDLYIAKSNAVFNPFKMLSPELVAAVQSPLANVRESAVVLLAGVVQGHHPAKEQRAASALLQQLADDDSRRVATAAAAVLGDVPPSDQVREDVTTVPVRSVEIQPAQEFVDPKPLLPYLGPREQVAEPKMSASEQITPVAVRSAAQTQQRVPEEFPTPVVMAATTASDPHRPWIQAPAGGATRSAWAGALLLFLGAVTLNDGRLFASPAIYGLVAPFVVTVAFVVGLISSVALLLVERNQIARRTVLAFTSVAGLFMVVQQLGVIVQKQVTTDESISSISLAVVLLVASTLLLVGSAIALRATPAPPPGESPTMHGRSRIVAALLTGTGGILFLLALWIPVAGEYFWSTDTTYAGVSALNNRNHWIVFIASVILGGLAIIVSLRLGTRRSSASDVLCGALIAVTVPAVIYVLTTLRVVVGSWTISTVICVLAATCLISATAIVIRSTIRAIAPAEVPSSAVTAV